MILTTYFPGDAEAATRSTTSMQRAEDAIRRSTMDAKNLFHGVMSIMTPSSRFWNKAAIWPPTDCWLWQGCVTTANGYGRFGPWKGKVHWAHRVAYELAKGPIPKGLTIDHLCRTRRCVNPAHLEAVTASVNVRRGGCSLLTHCKHGHPFDEANTYRRGGTRCCRACHVLTSRQFRKDNPGCHKTAPSRRKA